MGTIVHYQPGVTIETTESRLLWEATEAIRRGLGYDVIYSRLQALVPYAKSKTEKEILEARMAECVKGMEGANHG